jgi:hypothetical protein
MTACGDDAPPGDSQSGLDVPSIYAFESRFESGASSVSYSGQTFRHTLIVELDRYVRGLTADIDQGRIAPTQNEIRAGLEFYFDFDDTAGADVELTFEETTAQTTFQDISSAKNLIGKIAGQDEVGQHEDWSTALIGWGETGAETPVTLVRGWFDELARLAEDRANGALVEGPDGRPVSDVFVTADGRDLAQLIQKFLTGAVAYSQGADDYLDDDTPGKGLLSSNERDGDESYSILEHQWDEGFGYFGAARRTLELTDDEIAGGAVDVDQDGVIDLFTEFNFGHSTNAAKRDRGANEPTDFTDDAMQAFLEGRAILAFSDGPLSDDERMRLAEARDRALEAWEKSISATVVHYINDTLRDMNAFGTDDYSFEEHAKHWSEMKGFGLSLQFSPFAAVTDEELEDIHQKMGTAPVLATADAGTIEAYRLALLDARATLARAYGFDAANVGDENGEGGW